MTDAPLMLDYAVPTRRAGPFIRVGAAFALTSVVVAVAAWFMPATVSMAHSHSSSFAGCATGRLHGEELIFMAVVPLTAGGLTKVTRWLHVGPAWRVARLGTAATLAAYAVLWMDLLGVLNLIKFGSPFA